MYKRAYNLKLMYMYDNLCQCIKRYVRFWRGQSQPVCILVTGQYYYRFYKHDFAKVPTVKWDKVTHKKILEGFRRGFRKTWRHNVCIKSWSNKLIVSFINNLSIFIQGGHYEGLNLIDEIDPQESLCATCSLLKAMDGNNNFK